MSGHDGGSAFPKQPTVYIPHVGELVTEQGGMSLRDYFAAAALQTMQLANSWSDNPLYWEGVAKSAFVCADAMLKERAK